MDESEKKNKKKHKRTVVTVEEQPETMVEEKHEEKEKLETPDTDGEIDEATAASETTTSTESETAEPSDDVSAESQDAKDTQPEVEEETKTEKTSTKAVIFSFIVGLILGGLVSGGVFYYKDSVTPIEEGVAGGVVVQTTPTAENTSAPIPTATPEPVELSAYSLQVLNGSGVAGAAGEVAALLETAGFSDAQVGNASTSNYEETEVGLKEGVDSEVFAAVKEALGDYDVVAGDGLDEDSEYDVVVVVGQSSS